MKVIDKAVMPNGTKIQLEDWHEHNTPEYPSLYGYEIAAYPEAQRTSKYHHLVQGGRTFRIGIAQNLYSNYTDEMVLTDYANLKNGEKTLEDLAKHFWYGAKDAWYLGMPVPNNGY